MADPVGMGAVVDAELLAGGEIFLYAGQYAGSCEPTGYGSACPSAANASAAIRLLFSQLLVFALLRPCHLLSQLQGTVTVAAV